MKINIPIKKGVSLCAAENSFSGRKEICVGLMKDGAWVQDLAVIGQNYHFEDGGLRVFDGGFFVKVFADCGKEVFTDKYIIGEKEDSSTPECKESEDLK